MRFLFVILISLPALAVELDSKTEFYLAGNSYASDSDSVQKNQGYLNLVSDNKIKLGNELELRLSPEAFYMNKWYFEPKEFSLNYYGRKLNTSLGFYQTKKEGPDILDPLDYTQPKNYIDPLHSGKLSLLGLKTEYALNSYVTLELDYVILNRIPLIPDEDSPWYPREGVLPTQSENFQINLPDNPIYKISNNEKTEEDLKDNYIFKTKITTSKADIVLQMAETLSSSPEITPTLTGTLVSASPVFTIDLDNPIQLDVRWKKVKNYGGGVIVPLDRWGLIVKAFSNQEIDGEKKTTMTTVAFEKTLNDVTVILESAKQDITSRTDNSNLSTMTNLYENAQALGIRYAPNDKFSLLTGGLYDSSHGSSVATLRPKYLLTQNAYVELQLIAVGGRQASLLSYFDKADSASLKIGSSF